MYCKYIVPKALRKHPAGCFHLCFVAEYQKPDALSGQTKKLEVIFNVKYSTKTA